MRAGGGAAGRLPRAPARSPAPPACLHSAVQPAAPGEVPPAGEWETVRLRGSWRVGRTAGGSRNFASYPSNPRLPLSVPEGAGPRCVRITLRQHCGDRQCLPIGFHVFQAGSGRVGSACVSQPLRDSCPAVLESSPRGSQGQQSAQAALAAHWGSEQLDAWALCEV